MYSPESAGKILEMLAKNEEVIGELYTAYSKRLPVMRDFWLELANDENTHAMWIRLLGDMAAEGKLTFKTDRINITSLNEFSNNIKNEITKTSAELGLKGALSVAISLEENLIEGGYFEALDTNNPDLQKIFRDLGIATKEHAQKLRDALDQQNSIK
jgi:rubrerythrin